MKMTETWKRIFVYLGIVPLSFVLLYLLSLIFMLLGVYRLTAMSLSAFLAPALAWMTFPCVFWRPVKFRTVCVTLGCVLAGYGLGAILVALKIGLPYEWSGPYGLFNWLLYALLPAVFFELVIRFRPNWVLADHTKL